MSGAAENAATLGRLLEDARVGWSLGRTGAIAEFYRDDRETVIRGAPLSIATARGALQVACEHVEARLFAGEALSHAGDGWSQWLSLCLPQAEGRMNGHRSITEIGPDGSALDAASREELLFDLGIGGPYFQLSVRSASDDLIRALRAAAGRPLLEAKALVRSLMALSPTRVFESRLARIEVAQPIASADGTSPEGPHTHFLPDLIAGDGADSPSAPAGWVAQIVAYPPNPLRDGRGVSKPFDTDEYRAFQALLDAFADPKHRLIKRKVSDAVRSGASPGGLAIDAANRDSVRIALRQLRCLNGESPVLSRWRQAYDPA